MADEERPIIIVKKVKKGHGGHHGGAWKVAYADFVTAMMAFFMVMWIIGMDQTTKESIEGYFQDPSGFMEGQTGSPSPGVGSPIRSNPSLMPIQLISRRIEQQRYKEIGDSIKVAIEGQDGLGAIAAQVEVVMTDEGLRIELVEGGDGELFFEFGSANLKPAASRALAIIAGELRSSSTASVVLEGHTDATPYTSRAGYTNWELSSDRANAARRLIERSGLGRDRIAEVRGYASEQLRVSGNPYDQSNRRISILLPFTGGPAEVVERGTISMPDDAVPAMNNPGS